ncbi:MAG: type 1 glutamine amidotransferase [Anaerolineae bacterium]|nr:type 1 glutamine amidotransferase [Anaerolineae bacterium]
MDLQSQPSPRILVLDNSPRRLGTAWFGKALRALGCRVSAYHFWKKEGRPVALDRFDGMVISGSPASVVDDAPWILAELELIEQAERRDMPVLGVCFGAQLLGRAYYGQAAVQRSRQFELGWYQVCRTGQDDPLFVELPEQFSSFQFHLEEVLPQRDMRILAYSSAVAVQAFRIGTKPVWGTQFHFEVTPQAGRNFLRKTRRVYEPHGFRYETMIAGAMPTVIAPQLLRNFLNQALRS